MKKLKSLCLVCVLFNGFYAFADFKPNNLLKSTIIENAFRQQDFLIGEYLDFLNSDKWIYSGLSILDKNIYFSSYSQTLFLKHDYNPALYNSIPKKLVYQSAMTNKIAGLKKAYYQNYNEALDYFLTSLNEFTFLKDSDEIASVTQNLSKLYFLKSDFNASMRFIKMSEDHLEKSSEKMRHINMLLWKAQVYLSLGKSKEAELLILNRILLMKHSKNQEQQCYYILGKIYLKTKQYTQAKWFFIQASELARKLNRTEKTVQSLLFLAKTKNAIKDYELAAKDLFLVKKLLLNSKSGYKLDLFLENAITYSYLHDSNKVFINRQNFDSFKKQFLN